MFPLTNKEPYIMATGERTTLGDMLTKNDADITQLKEALTDLTNYVGDNNVKNLGYAVNQSLSGDATSGYKMGSGGTSLIAKVRQNTDYIVSRKSGQGNRFRIIGFVNEPTTTATTAAEQLYSNNSTNTYTVNSGSYNYLVFTYESSNFIAQDTAEAMIRDASITDTTYQPYAATNQELSTLYTSSVTVPTTYVYQGGSAQLIFRKRNNVVSINFAGSVLLFPAENTDYEIGDIPAGFIPNTTRNFSAVDISSFNKGLLLTLNTSTGKILIKGYGTGTNGIVNQYQEFTYIV